MSGVEMMRSVFLARRSTAAEEKQRVGGGRGTWQSSADTAVSHITDSVSGSLESQNCDVFKIGFKESPSIESQGLWYINLLSFKCINIDMHLDCVLTQQRTNSQ